MPVIGFLRSTSLADATHLVDAFRQGLKETGSVRITSSAPMRQLVEPMRPSRALTCPTSHPPLRLVTCQC
jgi:hypothetical protein